jgi:hypothetical protein
MTASHQVKHTSRERNWIVSWGKSSPPRRGMVEYIALHLPRPHDITLYLGDPASQLYGAPDLNPWQISVGNGGTSFVYNLGSPVSGDQSVRGNVLHFVADELIVRGDTQAIDPTPAGLPTPRFAAQAGLGRPCRFERLDWQTLRANGGNAVQHNLAPWSTHARLTVSDTATGGAPPPEFCVQQMQVLGSPPVATAPVMNKQPLSVYAQPYPLHPWANAIEITFAGPSSGGAGKVWESALAQTFVY